MIEEKEKKNEKGNEPEVKLSKDERIGYHKGAINTLMAERNELLRIASVTEELINAHIKELENLGVKLIKDDKKR